MAVNDLTTVMFVVQVLVLAFTLVSATSNEAIYEVGHGARLTREVFEVRLATHNRFRRQSPDNDSGISSPDAPADSSNFPSDLNVAGDDNVTESTTMKSTTTTTSTTTKQPTTRTTTKDPFEEADILHDDHSYYKSDIMKGKGPDYWIELENAPRHETLSKSHRVAAVIPLQFPFHFYGHEIQNVTVATGGFIYMSPFLHQWLTATQYIAPLMANFDPSLSADSNIYYESTRERFIVEWKNLMLKDQNSTGKFHFQTILSQDDKITFVYKKVPFPVSDISTEEHPVKVGLSDAYYNDTDVPEYKIKRRTIYEYHKVAVPMSTIKSGSVVVLTPLKTCNRLSSCDTCVKHENVKFDCRWCNIIGRCSDGLDWYRQHWDKKGCQRTSVNSLSGCPTWGNTTTTAPSTTKKITTTLRNTTRPRMTSPTWINNTTRKLNTPYPTPEIYTSKSSATPMTTTGTPTPLKFSSMMTTTQPISATPPKGIPGASRGGCAHTTDPDVCPSLPPPSKPVVDPLQPSAIKDKKKCADGKCKDSKDFPVAVVVIVILIIAGVLAAIGGWVFYAYTHPTSRSGMWLMEHRPSQIKAKIKFWKNNTDSSAKYKAESDA